MGRLPFLRRPRVAHRTLLLVALGAIASLAGGCGCGGGSSGGDGGSGGHGTGGQGHGAGTVCTDCTPTGAMTFALPSPAGATLWTTTTMDKILQEAKPPKAKGDSIQLFAAKNEVEPFQIAVNADVAGSASLKIGAFKGPSSITRVEVRRVGYVHVDAPSDPSGIPSSEIPDPLYVSAFGKAEDVTAAQNQPFWITVYVPKDAKAGDYTATLTVTVNGASADVPVKLHVFDFAIPDKIAFDGDWNGSFEDLGGSASLDAVEKLKDFYFEHRLVPSGVAWPAGLNYNGGVTYDCATHKIDDVQGGGYGFDQLGPKYIDGKGWNGAGFPSFEVMQFVDNSTPRPDNFCGVDRRGDAYGTDAYNAAWSHLLTAVDDYLVAKKWTDKGYYYVQNEPQGPDDYDIAAFLANLSKTAAPHLRIAVSEEPKPEIVENPKAMGHSYDLWWADLSAFEPTYAKTRQEAGDTVWWYFLYGDLPPHFNPITIDHPGIESRIPFWAAWKYRVKGFAYYSLTGWGDDPVNNPKPQGTNQNGDGFLLYPPNADGLVTSIRWELLREGEEDYEYLLLANGGVVPDAPGSVVGCDISVDSAVSSTTAFTTDASAFKHLRDQLGALLGGEVDGCPKLDSKLPGAHKRGAYYINFQDPKGEPSADPLMVNGHTWQKIGWEAYDQKQGYGWSAPNIGDPTIMLYTYQGDAPGNELQKSIIYDDYGRVDTFNFDIENGKYKITVGIGWNGGDYPKNEVVVEGQKLFDNAVLDGSTSYLEKSISVDVSDGNVTMEAGQFNEYTMLNYLMIEPD